MKKFIFPLLLVFTSHICIAGEGMWLPLLLKSLNEAEMQEMGMKMSAEDIYSVNQGSLKDAIVHFGGFCTSELISSEGLLLTNHHCGYRQIQSHTTLSNNYLKYGFWAKTKADEKPNPGLTATFIVSIADVTDAVLRGVRDDMTKVNRQSVIDKNIAELKKGAKLREHEEVSIKPFFHGNQYFSFVTITYKDVRLVGAPPEGIGKFGSDTDNWVWPRHTGDFSLFRIYADADNMPAEYSEDNVPYQPKHYLPISLDGVAEDDFTLVFGFPGRTNQYLPSYAVSQIVDVLDPARIGVREEALKIMDVEMRADEAVRIQYASKFAGIANYWKKWIGEVQGLKSSKAVKKKQKLEREFLTKVRRNSVWDQKYGSLLNQFKNLYEQIEPYALTRDYYNEVVGRNIEILRLVNATRRLAEHYDSRDNEAYEAYQKRVNGFAERLYKDYRPEIDQKVFAALMEIYFDEVDHDYIGGEAKLKLKEVGGDFEKLAASLYSASPVTKSDAFLKLLNGAPEVLVRSVKADPLYRFAESLYLAYDEKVAGNYNDLNTQIRDLQRIYMKAQMEVFPDKRFYPDANSTMRVTYGKVKGYQPKDAVSYHHVTYLDGVMEKYVPGDYEFDVPKRLLQLQQTKDYGIYGEDGKMPVCFIGTNHTTGGNSGSPAIDANGNLIGLNFDRVWEGTMSDINYDASICRNIMVDIRYILFIVDKYAGATHLIEEMKLVKPKTAPGQTITPPKKELRGYKSNNGKKVYVPKDNRNNPKSVKKQQQGSSKFTPEKGGN